MIVSTEHNILQIVRDEAGGAEGDQPEDPQEPSPSEPENEHPEKKMKVDESEKPNRKGDDKDDVSEATQISLEKGDDHKNENYTDAKDGISFDLRKYYLLMKEVLVKRWLNKNEEPTSMMAMLFYVFMSVTPTSLKTLNNDSNTNKNAEDNKDDKECDGEEREKKDEIKKGGARNLWISGLAEGTRAKDLKQFCRKHGKVIEAKVVTDAKTPGSHCYGFVVMASTEDAENCIKHLDKTEFNGRMITIVKAKTESESSREQTARPNRRSSKDRKKDGTVSQDKAGRSPSSCDCRRLPRDVRSLSTIRKERDAMRARERLRREKLLLRERERQQRHEKHRLEIERDKLRAEREQLEREKREILRIERERETLERDRLKLEQQRLEQEKLELERLELKQTQLSQKQPQFAAPPPPRVEISAGYNGGSAKPDRDNPRQVSSGNPKCLSNGNVNVYARQPMPPSTRPKGPSRPYNTQDKRSYNWRDNRSYRPPAPYKPVNSYAPTWYPVTAPPATGYVSGIGQAWPNQPYYGSSKSGGGAYEAYYQPVSAFTGMSGWGYNY